MCIVHFCALFLRCFCASKFGRFCAVLRCESEISRIMRCFARFCAAQKFRILRCFARFSCAKISQFALFCAFTPHKNSAKRAFNSKNKEKLYDTNKLLLHQRRYLSCCNVESSICSSCSAQFIEPDFTCTLCSQKEIQESTIGKKI